MTVGNPENFKIQIKTGREDVDNRVPCDLTNLTLTKLFAWIDGHQISVALKSELKRSASSFPHQALPAWQNNFEKYLSKAQSRLRKKRGSSPKPKPVEIEEIGESRSVGMKAPTSNDFDQDFDLPQVNKLENFDDEAQEGDIT